MPFVQANGLKFHTQQMGQGPPLVLVHGMLLSNLTSWYFQVAPELAHSFHVLMYDLRGHGKSQRAPSGYRLATMAEDLGALAEQFSAEPFCLAGVSYGALVSLRFALDNPQRVRRLVLVEAPLPPHDLEETRFIIENEPQEWLAHLEPDRIGDTLRRLGADRQTVAKELPPGFEQLIFQGHRRLRKLRENLQFLLAESTIVPDLRAEPDLSDESLLQLACPVLCVYGRQSKCRHVADRLVRVLSDVRLVELDGGHYVSLERPRELASVIKEFLCG